MTASRFDRAISSWPVAVWWVGISLLGAACRGGLPAEPPGHDAAATDAPSQPYAPPPNPYERSAFDGVRLDAGGGHEHMHHGGHGASEPAEAEPAAESEAEPTPHDHAPGQEVRR